MNSTFKIVTRKPSLLLKAVIEHFVGDAHLSVEGDLSRCTLLTMPGATTTPTEVLARNTEHPIQDFLLMPLEVDTVDEIVDDLTTRAGLRTRILHLQVEQAGRLVFGAYDCFHEDCVWIDVSVGEAFVRNLVSQQAIWRYAPSMGAV